jgi:16S rRNA (cytosine1402-N4)-methyltransferase
VRDHKPVLLAEVLDGLSIREDGIYVDGTFGRGGHAMEILKRLGKNGRLMALDKDPDAVQSGRQMLEQDARFKIIHGAFGDMRALLGEFLGERKVDGILLDLGVSSPQLETASRGFSFLHEGPLDMRMNNTRGVSAADWLNGADEKDIVNVLRRYGEEKNARRIAQAVVTTRAKIPITTTTQLADLIVSVSRPGRHGRDKKHPATRSFQAIRIFINMELEQLKEGLAEAMDLLAAGGRLCVISFHSLEDRMVKRFFRDHARGDPVYAGLPDIPPQAQPDLHLIGRAIRASDAEIAGNPRARSAVLRIAERISVEAPA